MTVHHLREQQSSHGAQIQRSVTSPHNLLLGLCTESGEWVGYSSHGTAFLLCFLLLGCQGSLKNARDSECIAAQCSDSTVSEVTLEEETEEGSGGGKAVAEAEALAGGSQAEGPSRGRPDLCFSFCGGREH